MAVNNIDNNTNRVSDELHPLDWNGTFDTYRDVKVKVNEETEKNSFRVYLSGSHECETVFIFIHGAGYTGLSWAPVMKELKNVLPNGNYFAIAPDLRSHGYTTTDDDLDLSNDTLVNDIVSVVEQLLSIEGDNNNASVDKHKVVMVGHSLGGALAVRIATRESNLSKLIRGLVVVDIVEGKALEVIPQMKEYIKSIPTDFKTIEDAIYWTTHTRSIQNVISARMSVPSRLVEKTNKTTGNKSFVWRTDLLASEAYWNEWFTGLSSSFLAKKCPKLIVLANWDELDNELLIAQMQSKFETQILHGSTHSVHEDQPLEFSRILARFAHRNGLISTSHNVQGEIDQVLQAKLLRARKFIPDTCS